MKFRDLFESLDLRKFDPIAKALPEARKKRAEEQLEALSNAVKTGVIYNVTYVTIKDQLGHALEQTLDIFEKSFDIDVIRFAYQYDVAGQYLNFSSCAKQLRDIDRAQQGVSNAEINKYLDGRRKIVEAGNEINKILKDLKPKIIKGRVPKPADPNTFVRKMGGAEAQKLVIDAVKPTVEKQLDDFEKVQEDHFQKLIDSVKSTKEITYKKEKGRSSLSTKITALNVSIQVFQVAQKFFEYDTDKLEKDSDKPYRLYNFKLTPVGKAWPKKESKYLRELIEKQFLSKTVAKLSHIVEKKANLDKIEVLKTKPPRINASMGTVEVGFKFLFTDSSSFEVNNKVVNKYNHLGTYFQQYPTTFHDVTFADGSKMKTPSEEKMTKEFIKP